MPAAPLPILRKSSAATLWVVGAHGGSGESSLAGLDQGWEASGHGWPALPTGAPAPCVVVARSNVNGLFAARSALTQWAASGAGLSAQLLGLVLIADAPGKTPSAIKDLATVVGGGAPRVWTVPWVEAWRLGDPVGDRPPRQVSKLVGQLRSLTAPDVGAERSHTKEKS